MLIPDRNHFDNPVYSYQGNGKRDDDRLLNNTNHIRNNLHKQINTTLEKQRLGAMPCCSTDDDDLSLKGASSESNTLKNKEADFTNPNIYHSIDKMDHIYYEIKQKDVKDIGK